jgi:hypothetical protein
MPAQPWRERREAYLRERGRLADLIHEGYIQNSLAVIKGGARRHVPSGRPSLILTIRSQDNSYGSNRPAETPAGEPAA